MTKSCLIHFLHFMKEETNLKSHTCLLLYIHNIYIRICTRLSAVIEGCDPISLFLNSINSEDGVSTNSAQK